MDNMEQKSVMLVFVNPGLKTGPVLAATGEFREDLDLVGVSDIYALTIEQPEDYGLQIFEGWIEHHYGQEEADDPVYRGKWSRVDKEQAFKVLLGFSPWEA